MITVNVGRLPGSINPYVLNDGATAADALRQAGVSGDGYELRVNSSAAEASTVLRDGYTVVLVKKVKGNSYIQVFVGQLPGRLNPITLNGGRTVKDALDGAGLRADGFDIRVNTQPATLTTNLSQGQTVVLVRRIKGN